MSYTRRSDRLGGLAVGVVVGAAAAAIPTTASADPFAPFDPNNFAISIDGFTLFQVGTAHATSGIGDFAIADGDGSDAVAEGGFGDFASADGIGSTAVAGLNVVGAGNNFDFASAVGPSSYAQAGFNGSFDSATAIGEDAVANAGFGSGATAANFDLADFLGNLTTAATYNTFADAEAGSGNLAFVIDPFGSLGSAASAGFGGDLDVAGVLGDNLGAESLFADFIFHIAPFF